MQKYRKLLILTLLLAGAGALGGYLYWRSQRSPEAVRLLPEGNRIVYVNFKPIHLLDLKLKPVQLEGSYRDFVEQTGIQFERDLDEAAGSWHDSADGKDVESAVIFVARFDEEKLRNYVQKISTQSESYGGHTVFSIPNDGRIVRVCLLDGGRVAVTNGPSADPIHSIIDRTQRASGGPQLLHAYYGNVPLASVAWMIDRIPANPDAPQLPGGLSFGFLENTVAVVSLRYNGAVLFRADVFAPTEADARNVADQAGTFLTMYRSVSRVVGPKGTDPDVKAALDSIHVEQKGNAAVVTATLSEKFVKKVVSEVQPEGLPTPPSSGKR